MLQYKNLTNKIKLKLLKKPRVIKKVISYSEKKKKIKKVFGKELGGVTVVVKRQN